MKAPTWTHSLNVERLHNFMTGVAHQQEMLTLLQADFIVRGKSSLFRLKMMLCIPTLYFYIAVTGHFFC